MLPVSTRVGNLKNKAASLIEPDLTLVFGGTPEIHPLAGDLNYHLVEVPAIAPPRTAPA